MDSWKRRFFSFGTTFLIRFHPGSAWAVSRPTYCIVCLNIQWTVSAFCDAEPLVQNPYTSLLFPSLSGSSFNHFIPQRKVFSTKPVLKCVFFFFSEAELLPQLQVPPVFRWCFCRGSNACLSIILWLDNDWGLLWGTLCRFPRNTSRHLLQGVVFLAMGPCIWMLGSNHFTMWFWRSFAVGFLETMPWPSCQHVRCEPSMGW